MTATIGSGRGALPHGAGGRAGPGPCRTLHTPPTTVERARCIPSGPAQRSAPGPRWSTSDPVASARIPCGPSPRPSCTRPLPPIRAVRSMPGRTPVSPASPAPPPNACSVANTTDPAPALRRRPGPRPSPPAPTVVRSSVVRPPDLAATTRGRPRPRSLRTLFRFHEMGVLLGAFSLQQHDVCCARRSGLAARRAPMTSCCSSPGATVVAALPPARRCPYVKARCAPSLQARPEALRGRCFLWEG
jgi:hypothetical protein